ncbi:Hypothetical protein MAU_2950 [Metamycoplasma auris 15026]|uniref:Uncharacterized protein n=1 Tax=Metamycoplasma auris 15026 TaxID=1188233 RepID=N9TRW4_9BACT|nr:hypothetical protein [Metamycoplasma auris]ENY68810.1 Hypothetical protein MAU_2950 [Metamycoplasma auris 15026]
MYISFEFANYKTKKRANEETKQIHNYEFYKSGKFIDYISRPSAVYVQELNDDRNSLLEKMKNKNVNFVSFINSRTLLKQRQIKEIANIEDKTGLHLLFNNEPKDIDPEIAKKQFKKLNKSQHVWEMIINPGDLGIKNNMLDKNEWNAILNKNMRSLLKANKLDPNNIIGYWTLHSNTNYPHIHLGFFEKEPNHTNNYRLKGKFDPKSISRFSFLFENAINEQSDYKNLFDFKNTIWSDRREIKKLFISTLDKINKTNQSLISFSLSEDEQRILKATKIIKQFFRDSKNRTYASANNKHEIKEAINEIFNLRVKDNAELNEKVKTYNSDFQKLINSSFDGKQSSSLKEEFINKEKDEFEKQIANVIIKNCLKMNLDNLYEQKIDTYGYGKKEDNESISSYLLKHLRLLDFELQRILRMRRFEALRAYKKNISTIKSKIIF